MREALSREFKAGILAYDDRPRGTWALDNCAQIAALVSRLFFTQEVLAAFERMEDGDEDAMKAGFSCMLVWTNTTVIKSHQRDPGICCRKNTNGRSVN
jgi:hypothetical protein